MSGHDAEHLKALRKALLARWAHPNYVDFPAIAPVNGALKIAVPGKIVTRSAALASAFLVTDATFPDDLVEKTGFVTPAHWALYWCITSASSFVCGNIGDADGENGRTGTFQKHLTSRMEHVGFELEDAAQIDIAVSPIWSMNKPAVKEAAVGADLLLVLDMGYGEPAKELAEGQTQSSCSPCVQLFWMQAKLVDTNERNETAIYTLDYGQKKKEPSKEVPEQDAAVAKAAAKDAAEAGQEPEFQFDRLYSVHDPARGSYAFYAQYANQIPFVPVVSVSDLVAPTKTKHSANLTENGARFAEWLVERTIPPSTGSGSGVVPDDVLALAVGEAAMAGAAGEDLSKKREARGSFSSCDEIVKFLEDKSAEVPFGMVTLCVRDAVEHMKVISRELEAYFAKRIAQLGQDPAAGKPSVANTVKPRGGTDSTDVTGKIGQIRDAALGKGPKTGSVPHAADEESSTPSGEAGGGTSGPRPRFGKRGRRR